MGKKINKLILVMLLFSVCLSMGCSNQSVSNEGQKADKTIAVILKGLTTSYWYAVKKGAEAAANDFQISVDIFAPVKPDNNEQQLQLLEDAVANGYQVICLSPTDSRGIISGVELANSAGIPVINYATEIIGDVDIASYIRIEDYDAEYKVTDALCKMIRKGKVIILEGPAGQQNAVDKTEGAKAAIEQYPDIELVASQTANWVRNEAYTVTQNLLQAFPDLQGIIACNDDMAVGAAEAVDQIGKTGKIFISGMNCAPFALESLKEGKIQVTIDIMAYELGYKAVENAAKIINGEEFEKSIVMDTILCTSENVDEMMVKQKRIEEE